jgi:hypothetical protein
MTSKLSQLLDLMQQDQQRRQRYQASRQAELAPTAEETWDILQLGYWPLSNLESRNHWLATGEPEDDLGLPWNGPRPTDQPVTGYLHNCYIQDHVHIWIHIAQGNYIESDGVSALSWGWGIMNSGPDVGHQQSFPITGFAQVDHLLTTEWPHWFQQQWPEIDAQMQKYCVDLGQQRGDPAAPEDVKIYANLCELAWRHWGPALQLGLENFEFHDWSALDEIQGWIQR